MFDVVAVQQRGGDVGSSRSLWDVMRAPILVGASSGAVAVGAVGVRSSHENTWSGLRRPRPPQEQKETNPCFGA